MQPAVKSLLTVSQLAEYLQISRRQVYVLIERDLPFVRVGRCIRFIPADVEAWLRKQSKEPIEGRFGRN
jgi:excisionase family DNA binding protein